MTSTETMERLLQDQKDKVAAIESDLKKELKQLAVMERQLKMRKGNK